MESQRCTPPPLPPKRLRANAELRSKARSEFEIGHVRMTHNLDPVPRMFERRALSNADADKLASTIRYEPGEEHG